MATDSDSRAHIIALQNAAEKDQPKRTSVFKENRPTHGKFDGHAGDEFGFGAERNAIARNSDGTAYAGFAATLPIQDLVGNFMIDTEDEFRLFALDVIFRWYYVAKVFTQLSPPSSLE